MMYEAELRMKDGRKKLIQARSMKGITRRIEREQNLAAYKIRTMHIDTMQEKMETLEKRDEPVSPICSQEIFGTFLVCGNCGEKLENVLEAESINVLPTKWQYCRRCGQAVKWE